MIISSKNKKHMMDVYKGEMQHDVDKKRTKGKSEGSAQT